MCACVLQLPTLGFLYVAGYIGSVGREYLNNFRYPAYISVVAAKPCLQNLWRCMRLCELWPGNELGIEKLGWLCKSCSPASVSPEI